MIEVKLANRPASPTLIKNYLRYQKTVANEVSKKFRGVIVAEMERIVNAVQRKVALAWLFDRVDDKDIGILSSNSLTPEELSALFVWIDPVKIDGVWANSPHFEKEFRDVATLACRQYIGGEYGFQDMGVTHKVSQRI